MNVIQIENLWKEYRLGVISHGTLSRDLQSWWARLRGKEDPNSKLQPMLAGQEKQIEGDQFWALRDINLEVKEGEILGIIGRNGAGKSTLLKLLSRITAPTKGQIKVKGRIASLLEVGTGFHPELTGRENIFMNGAILGMSKKEIKSKLDEIVDFSGIEQFIDTPVKRYSSGMYVRLAFAVAAHLEPEILVVDEVLAVGDAEFQKKCLGKMGEVSKAGRTVLFVSHNMLAVKQLCVNVALISGGYLKLRGDADSVIDQYIETTGHDEKLVAHSEWRKDDGIGDSCVKLLSVGVKDASGNFSSSHSLDSSIEVTMEYCIADHYFKDIAVHFWFYDKYNNCLFITNDYSEGTSYIQRGPGKYISSCIVPPFLLNEGQYYIDVYITTPENRKKHVIVNKALSFDIIEKERSSSYLGKVPGFFRVQLPWTLNCIK